ncbi:MAG TPA: hypothetical protein VFU86_01505 [Terriglobales bacterium]|nr:hypothetical protein [Terriglobales bacterium]
MTAFSRMNEEWIEGRDEDRARFVFVSAIALLILSISRIRPVVPQAPEHV